MQWNFPYKVSEQSLVSSTVRCFEEQSVEVSNDVESVTESNVVNEERVDINSNVEKDAGNVNERGVFVPWPKKVKFYCKKYILFHGDYFAVKVIDNEIH